MKKILGVILASLILNSAWAMPEGVSPVKGFQLERYLGTWYEIARLDHRFERNLNDVSMDYSMREKGGIKVLNRGYSEKKERWQEAEGKAFFENSEDEGHLKISFFGPFYGAYIIFELDEDYQYAFVSGDDTSYLWFMSRTPTVSPELKDHFIKRAAELGFDTDELIFVSHDRYEP